jgi:hypothetical protein
MLSTKIQYTRMQSLEILEQHKRAFCILQTCCSLENLKTYFSGLDQSTVWPSTIVARVSFKPDQEHMEPAKAGDHSSHHGRAQPTCCRQADIDGWAHCNHSLPGAYKRPLRMNLPTPFVISFPNAKLSHRCTHRWLAADSRRHCLIPRA